VGQYYKFINLDKKEKCDRNRFPMKLTEHSYVGNDYCNDILTLLSNEWKGDRVIHVGDYASYDDPSLTSHLISKLNREFNQTDSFYFYSDTFEDIEPNKVNKKIRYVYNLDKKEYLDLYHQPIINVWYDGSKAAFAKFNSFALLTACGNGQGGGDYSGCNEMKIGAWAGDHFVTSERKLDMYKDYKECNDVFYEIYNGSLKQERPYDFDSYNEYDDEAIKKGINHIENLIDRLKKYDRMPKYIKVDTDDLTEKEKIELLNRNLKEVKFGKDKKDDLCK